MTLNQIISRLRSLSLSHQQIDSFFFGDPWEFDSNGEINYAACFVTAGQSTINPLERTIKYNFKVYLLDRVGVSEDTEGNETEVISDMDLVGRDLISLIHSSQWDDWWIDGAVSFKSVTEILNDMCAGVVFDLDINIEYVPDVCQIPRDAIISEDGFYLLTEQGNIMIVE